MSHSRGVKSLEKIQSIIAKEIRIRVKTVKEDDILRDLSCDSLDCIEIMMAIEEEFDIALEDDRVEKLATVNDLAEYVDTLI